MRFGAAVSAVLLASVVATMPTAVRLAPALAPSCSRASIWLALLALAFLPLTLLTVALRHAIAALRLFEARSVKLGVIVAIVWGSVSFVLWTVLGAVLRATTHHHGLGGVTFAIGGLVAAVLALPFVIRIVGWAAAARPVARWTLISLGGFAFGIALAFVARVLHHNESASVLGTNVMALALASAFGAGAFPHRSRPVSLVAFLGPPLAAIVLAGGFSALRAPPTLRAAVLEQAPVFGPALALTESAPKPPFAPRSH